MSTMQQKRATWALLLMTFIWGYTFIWIKSALNAGDRLLGAEALPITVGLFMVIRFLGAALILPVALPAARERLTDPAVWRAGGVLSFFVLAGFLLQMFGMHGIDSATSAFLHESLRCLYDDRARSVDPRPALKDPDHRDRLRHAGRRVHQRTASAHL